MTADTTPESPGYMLTTDEVRIGFGDSNLGDGSLVDQETVAAENRADFDRWIFAHDAEVARAAAEKAWDEGKQAERDFQHRPRGEWYMTHNPYRAEQIGENRG